MRLLSRFATILPFVLVATAAPATLSPLEKRAQCATTLAEADLVANQLQRRWWTGTEYNTGELWTDANAYENLVNLMLAEGSTTYASQVFSATTIAMGGQTNPNWSAYINGSWDDAQWVILALYKAADYLSAHGQSFSQYMVNADAIYQIIAGQWDDTCGGGVWWSSAHTYKNAITNELFLLTSANGYLRTGNLQYRQNALKAWAWLEGSGMRNSQGLWNDGLDFNTCLNNGQTTWTYNQGVIASGLANLYAITGNTTLLDQAEITLDATIAHLTVNDILKESCDDAAAGGAVCNNDQASFKGIWMKHVQYYLDMANNAARTAKYQPFLGSQLSAIVHFGEDASQDVGTVWYLPNAGGSQFTPESTSSGLAGYVSAAKYGPC